MNAGLRNLYIRGIVIIVWFKDSWPRNYQDVMDISNKKKMQFVLVITILTFKGMIDVEWLIKLVRNSQ